MAAMDGTFSSTGYKTCSSEAGSTPRQEAREKHGEGVQKMRHSMLQRGHVPDRILRPCSTQICVFVFKRRPFLWEVILNPS